jgi:hypothetical protein
MLTGDAFRFNRLLANCSAQFYHAKIAGDYSHQGAPRALANRGLDLLYLCLIPDVGCDEEIDIHNTRPAA